MTLSCLPAGTCNRLLFMGKCAEINMGHSSRTHWGQIASRQDLEAQWWLNLVLRNPWWIVSPTGHYQRVGPPRYVILHWPLRQVVSGLRGGIVYHHLAHDRLFVVVSPWNSISPRRQLALRNQVLQHENVLRTWELERNSLACSTSA